MVIQRKLFQNVKLCHSVQVVTCNLQNNKLQHLYTFFFQPTIQQSLTLMRQTFQSHSKYYYCFTDERVQVKRNKQLQSLLPLEKDSKLVIHLSEIRSQLHGFSVDSKLLIYHCHHRVKCTIRKICLLHWIFTDSNTQFGFHQRTV